MKSPNNIANFMHADFAITYLFLVIVVKQYLGFDHYCVPREDVSKYAESTVKEGKIYKEKAKYGQTNGRRACECAGEFPPVCGEHGGYFNLLDLMFRSVEI